MAGVGEGGRDEEGRFEGEGSLMNGSWGGRGYGVNTEAGVDVALTAKHGKRKEVHIGLNRLLRIPMLRAGS